MEPASAAPNTRHPWALWGLLILFAASLYLAFNRIYQVDEAQNVYAARILASGWSAKYHSAVEIWHIWPLAWFAGLIRNSGDLLQLSRAFMLGVFWLNIGLTALNCGVPLKSQAFAWTLLGAATLAPLWDYGFEIRHENILLLFILSTTYGLRALAPRPRLACLAMGAAAALMQFATYKAFVFWLPMLGLLVLVPPASFGIRRIRIVAWVALGFLVGAGTLTGLLFTAGRLPHILDGFRVGTEFSLNASVRFSPLDTFSRLIYQTPLLSGLTASALVCTLVALRQNRAVSLSREGLLPEALLVLAALGALFVTPAPYPYNLCLLVPFAYVLAIRWGLSIHSALPLTGPARIAVFGIIASTHFLPFAKSTFRHFEWGNDRQHQIMALAEAMTDPATDRVYDAAGLVSARESIGRQWFLHSLLIGKMYSGQMPTVREMLAEHPASVLIPNYRFGWLQKEDVAFIQSHYVPLAGDFLVLGRSLQGPASRYTCLHPGRYHLQFSNRPELSPTAVVELDGKPLNLPTVVQLSRGEHAVTLPAGAELTLSWVGPTFKDLPRLATGNPAEFFYNWY